MELASPANLQIDSAGSQTQFASTEDVLRYIGSLLSLTMGASQDDLTAFAQKTTTNHLQRFVENADCPVLYVQKHRLFEGGSATELFAFDITTEMDSASFAISSLALIKRSGVLTARVSLQQQIQILNLPGHDEGYDEASAYESLHGMVKLALSPYLDSISRSKKASRDPKGIPSAKKKLAELELSLLHLQQNIEIPRVVLTIHPVVQQAIDDAIAESRRPTIGSLRDPAVLTDMVTMNAIQATTLSWRQQIKQIVEKDRDPASGSASQEINFWLNFDEVMADVELQLKSDPVALTFEVLAAGKRIGVNSAMISQDTGLKDTRDRVRSYNLLMRDFPINDLLSAPTLEKTAESVGDIFDHINRRLRTAPYPVAKAIPLVEAITRDIENQVNKLLKGKRLMYMEFSKFDSLYRATEKIFGTYEHKVRDFITTARDVLRKRNEKFLVIKVNPAHANLQDRLSYLHQFRSSHEKFSKTMALILAASSRDGLSSAAVSSQIDSNSLEEISKAFLIFRNIDVLDVSPEGTESWNSAENDYDERIAGVENSIIDLLRSRLDAAVSANDMFRIFSEYSALLIRPKIRGAIQEYQDQLVEGVKQDIGRLQDKFKEQYTNSDACCLALQRSVPIVSGHIIWLRQMNRQLDSYIEKIETVLGHGWHLYAEGQKLYSESVILRKKLDTKSIFEQWLSKARAVDQTMQGPVLDIRRIRAGNKSFDLFVNFDELAINFFREVRHLQHLGFNIPHQTTVAAKMVRYIYPHAMRMIDGSLALKRLYEHQPNTHSSDMLLASFQNDVRDKLLEVYNLRWESFREEGSKSRKATQIVLYWIQAIALLQNKTDFLASATREISVLIKGCQESKFDTVSVNGTVSALQRIIDSLNLEGYSNLQSFVEQINKQLESILSNKTAIVIDTWSSQFLLSFGISEDLPLEKSDASILDDVDNVLNIPHLAFEIVLKDQIIHLEPPAEHAMSTWYFHLTGILHEVCSIPRLQASRFELGSENGPSFNENLSFQAVIKNCVEPSLRRAYQAIRQAVDKLETYFSKWLHFQALWDLQLEDIWSLLDQDLSVGIQLLSEMRKARGTFDTTKTVQDFHFASIRFDQVQARINARYDAWQRDVIKRFAEIMAINSQQFFDIISRMRTELEVHTLDISRTTNAIAFITSVQVCRKSMTEWTTRLEQLKDAESSLRRNRYQFPPQWLSLERLDGEWTALQEIFQRRDKVAQDQAEGLAARIMAEHKVLQGKIEADIQDWHKQKPVSGDVPHAKALNILVQFGTTFNDDKERLLQINKAKLALDLEISSAHVLDEILEELQDFMSVWTAVSTVWNAISSLEDTLWVAAIPRDVRTSLDGLLTLTKEMPSRMRQYSAFEYVQSTLNYYIQAHNILKDLKSEALKDRHWLSIWKLTATRDKSRQSSVTLRDVWNLDLVRHEKIIKQILVEANGEFALEEYLSEVRERWQNHEVELVNYKNRTRLIKSWDDIFTLSNEDLGSLAAMKHSPYYKVFQSEAEYWEERITRIHLLFDAWIDVQRQWVYLEAVFSDNADIRQLLPIESTRFFNLTTDLFNLMKKVTKVPSVIGIIEIQDIQAIMIRFAESLQKVQKALGDYLERERSQFPRFYFVGDEDLLEMIGNASNVSRTQIHLKKMFAGISSLVMDASATVILGFRSVSGEEVLLDCSIRLDTGLKVHQWLKELEAGMKASLKSLLKLSITDCTTLFVVSDESRESMLEWINRYPAQILVLTTQCWWTTNVEHSISIDTVDQIQIVLNHMLSTLATLIPTDLTAHQRTKCESLITNLVHQRDVCSILMAEHVSSADDYYWLSQMRFNMMNLEGEGSHQLLVKMADAEFSYGFEYLGAPDRLVQTPLTSKCFLAMTQALHQRLGGSPFGPAGTGKTETVKALGAQLGRFVLVFNCDDTFDFQAMGRLFLGLCQVGAWGCFDEFNRLEERILSAVSQQIQTIQAGLKEAEQSSSSEIELIGRQINLHADTGIFITMNPNYAGRSNLPDNLKKLFRSIAMSRPDKVLIAEVTFFTQGFVDAANLAALVVSFFDSCTAQLSDQPHYDFGLRALKSVLVSCGNLRREQSFDVRISGVDREQSLVLQGLRESIIPKLVGEDPAILLDVIAAIFPNITYNSSEFPSLRKALVKLAAERGLTINERFIEKTLQLYQLQIVNHGIMLVGEAGTGKSVTWKLLSDAMKEIDGMDAVCHTIDAKVISKETLYGKLDNTTREWSDGLFTSTLRKIVDNLRGEDHRRNWIVFDGDVDPEWVENMNSVLDDNRLLTLANGERLALPKNTKIMFEVSDLRYATLATVSRCGMVYFNKNHVPPSSRLDTYLHKLRASENSKADDYSLADSPELRSSLASILEPFFITDGLVLQALLIAAESPHIMEFSTDRALTALFSFLNSCYKDMLKHNETYTEFPLSQTQIETFISRRLLLGLIWSFAGDCSLADRNTYSKAILNLGTLKGPTLSENDSVADYAVALPDSAWRPWQDQVPNVELNTSAIYATDSIISTVDTLRHQELIRMWLYERKPFILCGPPGSGKTMILFETLRKDPMLETVGLNFSSATTPSLILKSLEQYCDYKKTVNGVILSPSQANRWLVLFCDEINLPVLDRYGTQRAIFFLRQLLEKQGFWRERDRTWISIERVQFVGACNPPTDVGRTALSSRFLRHVPVLMVDYPGNKSMRQIYSTFTRAVLKYVPNLCNFSGALADAMIDVYDCMRVEFSSARQAHYIYSPRELTRWTRGIAEAIRPLETITVEGLVRIWAHEAHRLFADRLVTPEEQAWAQKTVNNIALRHFPHIDQMSALQGPLLYSNWLSKHYVPVDRDQLRLYIRARLRNFCEEEVNTPLVLYDDAIDQVLKIDRVFRQAQGHMILIGISGSGKTTLTRFVAWINGLSFFQIKLHRKYNASDFDNDLRDLLRRCGTQAEKICFILDESNILDTAFLERMNTLLANAEIPGLFEAEDFSALLNACKEGSQREGLFLDTKDELYHWFTQQVSKNLHVVFTMNPPDDLSSRAATSPALFNRCVLNWCGNWTSSACLQVASEMTVHLDLPSDSLPSVEEGLATTSYRDPIIRTIVACHETVQNFIMDSAALLHKAPSITPGHFLEFISQFIKLFEEKQTEVQDQQRHLNVGLEKLEETVEQVAELKATLARKKKDLEVKVLEANKKLQQMVTDQQEAEQKKIVSLEIQEALTIQEKEIAERRTVVLNDLALAEPAVLDAQASVSNIKKQQLTEVRSMANPPEAVKLAMESVCTLLGHNVEGWRAVQSIIRRDDFISSIVHFDNEAQMSPQLRDLMKNDYMTRPSFQYEAVNRASKACGPLVQWVAAQVNYSDILDRVEPLRQEVDSLESEANLTRRKGSAIIEMIQELEDSIASYKIEYAELISETQAIKSEMSQVQVKVTRSVDLLQSLTTERERWQQSTQLFSEQFKTIVGDVIISAAFLAYSGVFDQVSRHELYKQWVSNLEQNSLLHRRDLSFRDYLSNPDQQLEWQDQGLLTDDVSIENAIMLRRCIRYPLIVDPTGRAIDYLAKVHADRKLTITSFLDESFTKLLETALRFGNPILINDAEHFEPMLNRVLNKEYQKSGGRTLVRLGKQDIDISPTFKMYLATRNPSTMFGPEIASRVSMVNFTITRASMESQTLHTIMNVERPDIADRRSGIQKAQGEYQIRLRSLEQNLLEALSLAKGNILDDDNILSKLEILKKESDEISLKVKDTKAVFQELELVTETYAPIGRVSSSIFASLERLCDLNHFYRFSLEYFESVFMEVVRMNSINNGDRSPETHVEAFIKSLILTCFRRVSQTLLHEDQIPFALLLTSLHLSQRYQKSLTGVLEKLSAVRSATCDNIDYAKELLEDESRLGSLRDEDSILRTQPELLNQILSSTEPWHAVRAVLKDPATEHAMSVWNNLSLIKLLRAEVITTALAASINNTIESPMTSTVEYDLCSIVTGEVEAKTPILLASSPGYDAAYKVDALVREMNFSCESIAMGAKESLGLADRAINIASQSGSWVLVKNVHLAVSWLQQLEKRLLSLKPHKLFRLFLTMEASQSIPTSLLQMSRIFMYEAPPGLRANMIDSIATIPATQQQEEPVERARLYFLLAWLHAVIQERLRFTGLGWTKAYEFNDSDFAFARQIINSWLTRAAGNRTNIAPSKIPWKALQTLLAETIYGAKVDEPEDQKALKGLVMKYFTPEAYEIDYMLVDCDSSKLQIPDVKQMSQFVQWVHTLPEDEPPTWLGLHEEAQKTMKIQEGERVLASALALMRSYEANDM